MGVPEGLGDLDDDIEGLMFAVNLACREIVVEGFAFDVFHHEVVVSACLADVHGLDDIGVIEFACGLTLFIKTFDVFFIFGEAFWQDFDCDDSVQAELSCFINDGHSACAEFAENQVAGYLMGGG